MLTEFVTLENTYFVKTSQYFLFLIQNVLLKDNLLLKYHLTKL